MYLCTNNYTNFNTYTVLCFTREHAMRKQKLIGDIWTNVGDTLT